MNALALAPGLMLLVADERGMRPEFSQFLPGDLRRFPGKVALQILLAASPKMMVEFRPLDVAWVAWAERPSDFSNGTRNVLLVKVLGEQGIPQTDRKPSTKLADTKKRLRYEERVRLGYHASAGDIAESYRERDRDDWRADPGLRGVVARTSRVPSTIVPPVATSPRVVATCCGISHTQGSFDALELLGATDRTEGFTAIHETQRLCSCCRAVLTVTTQRLLGDGR